MVNEWQNFAGDLEKAYGADFVADFCKTLTDHKRAEQEMAFSRQRKAAEANARIEKAWMEGFGEHYASVDAEAFFYWSNRLGRACWNDKQFIKEFLRDNESARVKTARRKTSIIRP